MQLPPGNLWTHGAKRKTRQRLGTVLSIGIEI